MTTGAVESPKRPGPLTRGPDAPGILRIRLGEPGLLTILSNYLVRMGFNTSTVADDTIEVTPISPVSPEYDSCTMRAYFRTWHDRHADVAAELGT